MAEDTCLKESILSPHQNPSLLQLDLAVRLQKTAEPLRSERIFLQVADKLELLTEMEDLVVREVEEVRPQPTLPLREASLPMAEAEVEEAESSIKVESADAGVLTEVEAEVEGLELLIVEPPRILEDPEILVLTEKAEKVETIHTKRSYSQQLKGEVTEQIQIL